MTPRTLIAGFVAAALLAAQGPPSQAEMEAAQASYEKALAARPTAEMYQRLGLVLHLQNKYAQAAKAFESALRLRTDLWSAHLFLGIDLYRTNRFQEALEHLSSAERLHPGQLDTKFWQGATELALHHYWQGFTALEEGLAKDPNNVDALRLLAESYANRGTQLLNQVAEKHPDTAAGLQVQARALEFEGSTEAALQCYRKAAAQDPKNADIRAAIVRLTAVPATPQ